MSCYLLALVCAISLLIFLHNVLIFAVQPLRETRILDTGLAKGKRSNEYLEVNKAMKIIQRVRGLIENSNESIDNQKQELERSTSLVTTNIEHLRSLRAQVIEIKGEGMKEDVN